MQPIPCITICWLIFGLSFYSTPKCMDFFRLRSSNDFTKVAWDQYLTESHQGALVTLVDWALFWPTVSKVQWQMNLYLLEPVLSSMTQFSFASKMRLQYSDGLDPEVSLSDLRPTALHCTVRTSPDDNEDFKNLSHFKALIALLYFILKPESPHAGLGTLSSSTDSFCYAPSNDWEHFCDTWQRYQVRPKSSQVRALISSSRSFSTLPNDRE